jgi:vacuolar-type H+-ATPase subunit H
MSKQAETEFNEAYEKHCREARNEFDKRAEELAGAFTAPIEEVAHGLAASLDKLAKRFPWPSFRATGRRITGRK